MNETSGKTITIIGLIVMVLFGVGIIGFLT